VPGGHSQPFPQNLVAALRFSLGFRGVRREGSGPCPVGGLEVAAFDGAPIAFAERVAVFDGVYFRWTRR
jgi:hypothetical protein